MISSSPARRQLWAAGRKAQPDPRGRRHGEPTAADRRAAAELIWTGRRTSGAEAKEYRIVNHVVEKGKALAKVREIVEEMKGSDRWQP